MQTLSQFCSPNSNDMNSSTPSFEASMIATTLRDSGFVEGNIEKDLGTVVKGLIYLYRCHQGQHQYVSLMSYAGNFCGFVVLVFEKQFNSRAKPPMVPIFSATNRWSYDIYVMVDKVYNIPTKKS